MSVSFAAAAHRLLSEQSHRLPDLSGVTVLVPHHHVTAPFLATLRERVAMPVFLPPRLATLPDLSAPWVAGNEIQTDGQRLAALHGFLGRVGWLEPAALWPLAQTMLDLLHALDDARLVPPADYGGFGRQIELAIRRAAAAPLEREARLVFELWRAFHQAGPGSRGGYALGLSRWRAQADGPLYSLGLSGLSRLEEHFLAACRDTLGLVELPLSEPYPERRRLLDDMLRPPANAPSLRERALARVGPSPLELELIGAQDMEEEAWSAARRIRSWLGEGWRSIAIVALDRLAARRLRAVLERSRILVQDETGWTFATASVSHVLDRWLALLRGHFYHGDLFDFLKSPFVFADMDTEDRQHAVAALEQRVGRHNVVAGLARFQAQAVNEAAAAAPMLDRLATAAAGFAGRRRRTLADWLGALFHALDVLGATAAMATDPAGRQLLDLLHRLATELAGDETPHSLSHWHGWLELQLDRATFVAEAIDSPVRLTHPSAARLRDFDAVVVLGADAAHLPPAEGGDLLGDDVRVQLGLPGRRERGDALLDDLIDILSRSGRALVTWQAWRGTEPNPRSPWLDRLAAFHALAHGDSLARQAPGGRVPVAAPDVPPSLAAPVLAEMPSRLSASAWQALVTCPYRYFARHGLGLGEREGVEESMAKADYGERVHELLRRFHEAHPVLAEHPREALDAALRALTEAVFREPERDDYLVRAWRLRWQRRIPAYLDWVLAREASGRRWRASEVTFERELALPGWPPVRLYGRLDRLDDGPEGLEVLDYKTQARAVLRARLKTPGEDTQLSFYGLLAGPARAGLVALDDDTVDSVEMPRPFPEAVAAEAERLNAVLTAMAAGAPLPAQGAPEACAYCEMRGLCRRA